MEWGLPAELGGEKWERESPAKPAVQGTVEAVLAPGQPIENVQPETV